MLLLWKLIITIGLILILLSFVFGRISKINIGRFQRELFCNSNKQVGDWNWRHWWQSSRRENPEQTAYQSPQIAYPYLSNQQMEQAQQPLYLPEDVVPLCDKELKKTRLGRQFSLRNPWIPAPETQVSSAFSQLTDPRIAATPFFHILPQ